MAKGRFGNPLSAAMTGLFDLFRKQELEGRFSEHDRFDGKTVAVTGATSGLGYAIALEAAKRGANLILCCRRMLPDVLEKIKACSTSGKVEMRYIDLSKLHSIHEFIRELKKDNINIDVFYFNAASSAAYSRITDTGQDELFMVNYLSSFILSQLLLSKNIVIPDSAAQPRFVFISSDSHQGASAVDYDEFGSYFKYGVLKAVSNYSYFKLLLNMFAVELSRRINTNGVKIQINCICPGPVNSNIIKETPLPVRLILRLIFTIIFRSPAKAVLPVIYLGASDDFRDKTAEYLHMFRHKKMDEKVYDQAQGKKLFDRSSELWRKIDNQASLHC